MSLYHVHAYRDKDSECDFKDHLSKRGDGLATQKAEAGRRGYESMQKSHQRVRNSISGSGDFTDRRAVLETNENLVTIKTVPPPHVIYNCY